MSQEKEIKLPKKGAVARITEERKKLRNQPVSPELREILKKKKDSNQEEPGKKIASTPAKRDRDLEL